MLRLFLRLIKSISAIIIFFSIGVGLQQIASAAEYDLRGESVTVVLGDKKAQVQYFTKIVNISDQYLLTKLDFDIPIKTDSINVTIDDWAPPITLKDKHLTVDLSSRPIDMGEVIPLELVLESDSMLSIVDVFDRVFIPNFDLTQNGEPYQVLIQVPTGWKQIVYASTDYTEENTLGDSRQINITTTGPVFFIFGELANYQINAKWSISNGPEKQNRRLPLPVSPWSNFIFYDLDNTSKAIKDEVDNEYLLLELNEDQIHIGGFSGYVTTHERPYVPQTGTSKFLKGIDVLKIDSDKSPSQLYVELLEKFVPDKSNSAIIRRDITEISLSSTQTSLDYANALVSLYRSKGIEAEVVYGVVNYPLINENRWHFWVMYKDSTDNDWSQIDPYLEDLLSFDFFTQVNPERVMWGVLGDDTKVEDIGLQYYKDLDSLVVYDAVSDVIKYEVEIVVDVTDTIYSGRNIPVNLIVHNDGNTAMYFKEINFENVSLTESDIGKYLIIPEGAEIVPIRGAFVRNPLLSGEYKLEGNALVDINGEEHEIPFSKVVYLEVDRKTIYLNSTMLLFGVYISYFVIKKYTNKKNV